MNRNTKESSHAYRAFMHDRIKKLVPDLIPQKCTILDFGSGDGLLTHFMHNTFFNARIIGVDTDKLMVQEAANAFPTLSFMHTEQKNLPFADETFDLVYAVDVFHHIEQSDHAWYVAELMRVLKRGGYFIMFEINPYNIFSYIRFKRDAHEKDNSMLTPFYAAQLLRAFYGNLTVRYYYASRFLPQWVKEHITWVPCGSIYSVLLRKK